MNLTLVLLVFVQCFVQSAGICEHGSFKRSWKFINFSTIWIFETIKITTINQNCSRGWMLDRNECPSCPHSELVQLSLDFLYQSILYMLHIGYTFEFYLGKNWLGHCPVSYWSCWCIGSAICGGTLMNLSLSRKPTGLLVSFKSLSSCSTVLFSQFFSQRPRTNSLICSAHWVP